MYVPTWPCLSPAHLFSSAHGEPLPFPLNASSQSRFFAARYGIYQLFRALNLSKDDIVLVPDYHHGNEVQALRAAGVSIQFYPIRRNLEPDLEQLDRLSRMNAKVLYVIHYLGWPQPMKELMALCRERDMILVEDCALAMLSESNGDSLGSLGDYSFFCLYKTLPVPNGGVLVQNRKILPELERLEFRPCDPASVASRSLELTLEWLRSRSNGFGEALTSVKRAVGQASSRLGVKRLPIGNTGFDVTHANIGASSLSNRLLKQFNYDRIRQRRRDNFRYLADKLGGKASLLRTDLPEGVVPLFLPILVPDKHAAAEAMWEHGIGAVEFWNEGDAEAAALRNEDCEFLRNHVLELPIHQDVSGPQLDYMADHVLRLKLHF